MDFTGLTVFCGLDLSESADLTALVIGHCDPNSGVWHVRPIFWLPEEGLAEKSSAIGCPMICGRSEGF